MTGLRLILPLFSRPSPPTCIHKPKPKLDEHIAGKEASRPVGRQGQEGGSRENTNDKNENMQSMLSIVLKSNITINRKQILTTIREF